MHPAICTGQDAPGTKEISYLFRWWFLFSWCFLGALTAPSLFGQQPAAGTTAPAATPAAEAPQDARQSATPVVPQTPTAVAEAQEIQQIHHQPPGAPEPQALEATKSGEDEADGDQTADESDEEPLLEEGTPAPSARSSTATRGSTAPRQSALARQTASIQRQLGRARGNGRSGGNTGGSDFFVSSWFTGASGNAASPLASAASGAAQYAPPSECDPLDQAVAEAFMRDSATREGVSLDLVREVIRQESGFQPCVVSAKGAMGMMQLMPDTASTLGVLDPFDPRENIDGGVRLLKRLLDKYQGRPDLALAAYNAGEGAVDRNNEVPGYEETRNYVRAIMQRVFEAPPEKQGKTRAQRIAAPARIPSPRTAFPGVTDGATTVPGINQATP
jgi:soluble lytic murein transglycosylase-like protein